MTITLDDIQTAAPLIGDFIKTTPCLLALMLSGLCQVEARLKLENLRFTASFKECGALLKLLSPTAGERFRGVISISAGNHARAVAYHARYMGIPAIIVMPGFIPDIKDRHLVSLNPSDGDKVFTGHGTIALEMLKTLQEFATLIPIVKQYVDKILPVIEENIEETVLLLLEIGKSAVEGASRRMDDTKDGFSPIIASKG